MGDRDYSGGAAPITLKTALGPTDLSFDVDAIQGVWPQGDAGGLLPFYIVIDRGTPTEEKVLIRNRSGTTFQVANGGRGVDDTSAVAHSAGSAIEHVWTAVDAREANRHVNDSAGVHGLTASDRVVGAAELTDGLNGKVSVGGDTMTGPLILPNDAPGGPTHAAPKSYVDAQVTAEANARQSADTAHVSNPDPHPQYQTAAENLAVHYTKAESDARFVDAAGDTMTGPLNVEPAGSGTGLLVKQNLAGIELWSPSSPVDKRRWQASVDSAGRLQIASLKDDGSSPVIPMVMDRDGAAWAPGLPGTVRNTNAAGSAEWTGGEDTWNNLPGVQNLGVTLVLPHRALVLVEFGVWATLDAPVTGTGYFALSFIMGNATVQPDPLHGATWGLIPRVATRAGDQDADETINGTRVVVCEAGSTNIQLKGYRNYSVAQAADKDAFTAYPVIQATPLRFVA